jgi:predicted  nucleic acid-binding Zn-ribbon protein
LQLQKAKDFERCISKYSKKIKSKEKRIRELEQELQKVIDKISLRELELECAALRNRIAKTGDQIGRRECIQNCKFNLGY